MDEPGELHALAKALRDLARWQHEVGTFGVPPAAPEIRDSSSAPDERRTTPIARSAPPPAAAPQPAVPAAPAAPMPPPRPRPERLAALREIETTVTSCTRCRLHEGRTRTVFGVGDAEAKLCFVGEGPGRDEDLQGEPFVGRAGQLLTKMIRAMGLAREQVYICNVVKCRPPENRTPLPDEMGCCAPFLDRQLELVSPTVIVALGACAAKQLLGTTLPMSRLRGRFHDWRGVPVMPTYHPAYLLRNEEAKRPVWEDLQQVMSRLGLARPRPSR